LLTALTLGKRGNEDKGNKEDKSPPASPAPFTNLPLQLVQRLVEATRSLNIGLAESPSTQVGPVIDANARDRIKEYIEQGKKEAQAVLEIPVTDTGYFVSPTIFSNVAPTAAIAQEEIFGPVIAVIKVKDFNEAISVANGTNFALTGGLYSRTPSHIQQAEQEFDIREKGQ
jgi:RHH-type transcriptional regulator, proline utilization regulon repressor / proline dehydrogenase / delta 1-pyrroline-5-carboxylate dehydrogenase